MRSQRPQETVPTMRNVWLLIGIGVAAIIPLEAYASGWWHVAAVSLIFVAMTGAVSEFRRGVVEQLRRSESQLQLRLQRMPVACITTDRNKIITSWNPAGERIFGWAANEIIGRPAAVLLPDGFTSELNGVVRSVLGGGVVERHVNENITKDGRIIVCRWANAPLVENGDVIGILGMAEDVTEEHKIEEELKETRARHHNLLDALPHYVFSLDNDDRYLALNAQACSFFGRPEEEIVGRTAEELGIAPETARQWREMNALTREKGTKQELDIVVPGPEPRHEHVIIQPLRNQRGEVVGISGVAIDATDAQRAEQARRRLDEQMAYLSKMEALGTLAGGISHSFNNILSVILTHGTVLERRCPDTSLQRSITAIKEAVDRGATISRQILTFAGRAEVRAGEIDVTQLVSQLYRLVTETFPRTIRVQVARDPDLPRISGDRTQLQQALLNLCINARDAMPDGGVLSIETRRAGDRVMIAVSDEGTGLDEETRRRIFEPFYTTKEKAKGMELGLAMVYGIAQAHGAEIEVESEPGAGTTFRIYFPIAAPPVAHAGTDVAADDARGRRLLVIEDEPEILAGLEMQLEAEGYVVQTARNGRDAMKNFREIPDLVLMDLGMPEMGAVELIDALRAREPTLRIVAMTGYVDPEVHAGVRDAGIVHILQKPFTSADLLATLKAALRA